MRAYEMLSSDWSSDVCSSGLPGLCFGAAGAGLDVDERGVGGHLAGEHALELELVDAARVTLDVGGDRVGGLLVVFGLDQVQQFVGAGQAFAELADAGHGVRNGVV